MQDPVTYPSNVFRVGMMHGCHVVTMRPCRSVANFLLELVLVG
jgi:hypothetical protein